MTVKFRIQTLLAAMTLLALAIGSAHAAITRPSPDGLDATVVDIDTRDRTLTVRLAENRELATFPVARDATFHAYNGIQDVPVAFSELTPGDGVALAFEDIRAEAVLNRATKQPRQ